MTWGNPPIFQKRTPKRVAALISPEQLAASGTEDGHQSALFCWAVLNCGQYPQLKWMYAVPNGGERSIIEATKLVATGTRAGVPDICLPYSSPSFIDKFAKRYHALYIELKIEKYRKHKNGGCSKEQLDYQDYLSDVGYCVKICYGWLEARDVLIKYLEGKL